MILRSTRRALLAVAVLAAFGGTGAAPAAADASPLPVLLVHGWHGIGDDTLAGSSLAPLGRRLAADGHRVEWLAGLGATPDEPLDAAAATLGRGVVALGEATGLPVVVVAHSYGGIVARAYLEGEGYARDFAAGTRVASLVTLGTPMGGIDLWLPLMMLLGDPLGEPSVWQMTPAWMSAFNAAHHPRPDVHMVAVAGDARAQAWPLRLLPASDGVVTLDSAMALDERRFGQREPVTDDVHSPSGPFAAFGWHDYMSHAPTYRDVIRPALRGLGAATDAADGGRHVLAVSAPGDDGDAAGWRSLDVARGPAVRASSWLETDGAGDSRDTGPAPLVVAAYAVALAGGTEAARQAAVDGGLPGAPTLAAEGDALDTLSALVQRAEPGKALDVGVLPGMRARAALVAAAGPDHGAGAPRLDGESAAFPLYAPSVPHPVVSAVPRSGGLRVSVSASDGRRPDEGTAWAELIGGGERHALALVPRGAALVADIDLAPGAYVVRAGFPEAGRPLEALVTASVPAGVENGARIARATWCGVAGGAAKVRADVVVPRAGRYLIAVQGRDASGHEAARAVGWRTLTEGANAVSLEASAGDGPVARLDVALYAADLGLAPFGGGSVGAAACDAAAVAGREPAHDRDVAEARVRR